MNHNIPNLFNKGEKLIAELIWVMTNNRREEYDLDTAFSTIT